MKKIGAFILTFIMLSLCLISCGKDLSSKLIGTWYEEQSGITFISIYDDGTCQIGDDYAAYEWSIVNKDQLKIQDRSGDTIVLKVKKVTKKKLIIIEEGEEIILLKQK